MPLYLAYLGMGAIGPDKINLKMSEKDGLAYKDAILSRNRERRDGGQPE